MDSAKKKRAADADAAGNDNCSKDKAPTPVDPQVQSMLEADEELARKLHEELNSSLTRTTRRGSRFGDAHKDMLPPSLAPPSLQGQASVKAAGGPNPKAAAASSSSSRDRPDSNTNAHANGNGNGDAAATTIASQQRSHSAPPASPRSSGKDRDKDSKGGRESKDKEPRNHSKGSKAGQGQAADSREQASGNKEKGQAEKDKGASASEAQAQAPPRGKEREEARRRMMVPRELQSLLASLGDGPAVLGGPRTRHLPQPSPKTPAAQPAASAASAAEEAGPTPRATRGLGDGPAAAAAAPTKSSSHPPPTPSRPNRRPDPVLAALTTSASAPAASSTPSASSRPPGSYTAPRTATAAATATSPRQKDQAVTAAKAASVAAAAATRDGGSSRTKSRQQQQGGTGGSGQCSGTAKGAKASPPAHVEAASVCGSRAPPKPPVTASSTSQQQQQRKEKDEAQEQGSKVARPAKPAPAKSAAAGAGGDVGGGDGTKGLSTSGQQGQGQVRAGDAAKAGPACKALPADANGNPTGSKLDVVVKAELLPEPGSAPAVPAAAPEQRQVQQQQDAEPSANADAPHVHSSDSPSTAVPTKAEDDSGGEDAAVLGATAATAVAAAAAAEPSSPDSAAGDEDQGGKSSAAAAALNNCCCSADDAPTTAAARPCPADLAAVEAAVAVAATAGHQGQAALEPATASPQQQPQPDLSHIRLPKLPMVRFGKRWYRAHVVRDGPAKVLLEYSGFEGQSGPFWLPRDSDRIWRGSYKGKDWRHLGDGAWEPKVRNPHAPNHSKHHDHHTPGDKAAVAGSSPEPGSTDPSEDAADEEAGGRGPGGTPGALPPMPSRPGKGGVARGISSDGHGSDVCRERERERGASAPAAPAVGSPLKPKAARGARALEEGGAGAPTARRVSRGGSSHPEDTAAAGVEEDAAAGAAGGAGSVERRQLRERRPLQQQPLTPGGSSPAKAPGQQGTPRKRPAPAGATAATACASAAKRARQSSGDLAAEGLCTPAPKADGASTDPEAGADLLRSLGPKRGLSSAAATAAAVAGGEEAAGAALCEELAGIKTQLQQRAAGLPPSVPSPRALGRNRKGKPQRARMDGETPDLHPTHKASDKHRSNHCHKQHHNHNHHVRQPPASCPLATLTTLAASALEEQQQQQAAQPSSSGGSAEGQQGGGHLGWKCGWKGAWKADRGALDIIKAEGQQGPTGVEAAEPAGADTPEQDLDPDQDPNTTEQNQDPPGPATCHGSAKRRRLDSAGGPVPVPERAKDARSARRRGRTNGWANASLRGASDGTDSPHPDPDEDEDEGHAVPCRQWGPGAHAGLAGLLEAALGNATDEEAEAGHLGGSDHSASDGANGNVSGSAWRGHGPECHLAGPQASAGKMFGSSPSAATAGPGLRASGQPQERDDPRDHLQGVKRRVAAPSSNVLQQRASRVHVTGGGGGSHSSPAGAGLPRSGSSTNSGGSSAGGLPGGSRHPALLQPRRPSQEGYDSQDQGQGQQQGSLRNLLDAVGELGQDATPAMQQVNMRAKMQVDLSLRKQGGASGSSGGGASAKAPKLSPTCVAAAATGAVPLSPAASASSPHTPGSTGGAPTPSTAGPLAAAFAAAAAAGQAQAHAQQQQQQQQGLGSPRQGGMNLTPRQLIPLVVLPGSVGQTGQQQQQMQVAAATAKQLQLQQHLHLHHQQQQQQAAESAALFQRMAAAGGGLTHSGHAHGGNGSLVTILPSLDGVAALRAATYRPSLQLQLGSPHQAMHPQVHHLFHHQAQQMQMQQLLQHQQQQQMAAMQMAHQMPLMAVAAGSPQAAAAKPPVPLFK